MKNADMPAFPVERLESAKGLTKRECFAALALQGILSAGSMSRGPSDDSEANAEYAAMDATMAADALLKELEKTK